VDELIGKTLGQYQITEKIGEGGMAYVYKAYQPSLNRFVAIKILSPEVAKKTRFTERFQREAHSVARLNHPHILAVHDFGVQGGYNYIVMRYVEHSRTLDYLIATGTPLNKLIDYIIQVADALNYAHEQGIIHRDVKPSNILIDGKWALLGDFGLVKMSEVVSTQLTGTGFSLGTPAYMSPEQVDGIDVDYRTDIYALGTILYKILTGTIPHDAPTPIGILAKRRSEPVPLLRQIKPDISIGLEQVTLRSLAMKREDRYDSAADFAEALKKAQADPNYREKWNGTAHPKGNLTLVDDVTRPHLKNVAPRKNLGLIVGGVITVVVIIAALVFALTWLRSRNDDIVAQPTSQITSTAAGVSTISEADTPTATPTPVPPSTPQAQAQTNLEIWSGPGDEYDLLGYLPTGASAVITGRDETEQWWQIRTSLGTTGFGWIKAGSNLSEATNAQNMPIALAPPTPTGTATPVLDTPTPISTPTPKSSTSTPNSLKATATPTLAIATATLPAATVTAAAPATSTPTSTPIVPTGQFTLLRPTLDTTSSGSVEFEWRWDGSIGPDQGFEIRVWREGEPPAGAHNAVEDNRNGYVVALGNNTYRLSLNIRDAAGVKGRGGEYLWTVVLVQINPEYRDLGIQASPGRLQLGFGGGGGGGSDGGGSSGGGGTVD
jgi:serine/threonine protein kinase